MLDLLLAIMVGGSVIAGFATGFTRTAFGLIAVFLGVVLGFWFYETPGRWLAGLVGSQTVGNMFGFLAVFLAVMIAGAIAGRIVSGVFKVTGLGFIDRIAGAAFGFVRGAFVAAAAVAVLVAATPRPVPNWMRDSKLLPYALGASDFIAGIAPQSVKSAVSESVGEIKKAWSEEVQKAKRRAESAFEPEPAPSPKAEPKQVEIVPPAKRTVPKAAPKTGTKTKSAAKTPKTPPPKSINQ